MKRITKEVGVKRISLNKEWGVNIAIQHSEDMEKLKISNNTWNRK